MIGNKLKGQCLGQGKEKHCLWTPAPLVYRFITIRTYCNVLAYWNVLAICNVLAYWSVVSIIKTVKHFLSFLKNLKFEILFFSLGVVVEILRLTRLMTGTTFWAHQMGQKVEIKKLFLEPKNCFTFWMSLWSDSFNLPTTIESFYLLTVALSLFQQRAQAYHRGT